MANEYIFEKFNLNLMNEKYNSLKEIYFILIKRNEMKYK